MAVDGAPNSHSFGGLAIGAHQSRCILAAPATDSPTSVAHEETEDERTHRRGPER
jgi:hypothetical protein